MVIANDTDKITKPIFKCRRRASCSDFWEGRTLNLGLTSQHPCPSSQGYFGACVAQAGAAHAVPRNGRHLKTNGAFVRTQFVTTLSRTLAYPKDLLKKTSRIAAGTFYYVLLAGHDILGYSRLRASCSVCVNFLTNLSRIVSRGAQQRRLRSGATVSLAAVTRDCKWLRTLHLQGVPCEGFMRYRSSVCRCPPPRQHPS